MNCLNSLQGPCTSFSLCGGERMKVEGTLRCLKSFWNPEVGWILCSPKGLSRMALNSESITSRGPWAPALTPPSIAVSPGWLYLPIKWAFICPLKQPPVPTLLSKHLCLQRCLVGLGGLFWKLQSSPRGSHNRMSGLWHQSSISDYSLSSLSPNPWLFPFPSFPLPPTTFLHLGAKRSVLVLHNVWFQPSLKSWL